MVYEFGPFSLNTRASVLLRDNQPVSLKPKELKLLRVLIERRDRVVSRQELLDLLWGDAFVEEGTLSVHMSGIRKALGDRPRGGDYIETVARQGYRFKAEARERHPEVKQEVVRVQETGWPSAPARPAVSRTAIRLAYAALLALAFLIVVASVSLRRNGAAASTMLRVVTFRQLTYGGGETVDTLLRVGRDHVYFDRRDSVGTHSFTVSVQGGATRRVWTGAREFRLTDVASQRAVALAIGQPCAEDQACAIWIVPLAGDGPARQIGTLMAHAAVWSPDERRIAFCRGHDLYIANADGTATRLLATVPRLFSRLAWSPDGTLLRFALQSYVAGESKSALWEIADNGNNLRPVLPTWTDADFAEPGNWTPDGRYFVFSAWRNGQSDLWLLHGSPDSPSQLIRLTDGPFSFVAPRFSHDGKTVFAFGPNQRGEMVQFNFSLKRFVPSSAGLVDVSATQVRFSRDGQWMTYVAYPERTLWRSRPDGSEKMQLTFSPFQIDGHAWSPDGRTIALHARSPGRAWQIYLMPAAGGQPQRLMAGDAEQGIPSWSPDSVQIVFGDVPPLFGHAVGHETIHVYDLVRHQLSILPGSQGLWTARWSPDGRYIAALTIVGQELTLFDVKTSAWHMTSVTHVNDPTWSRNSQMLYFDTEGAEHALCRLRVADGQFEKLAGLDGFSTLAWSGLTAGDSPLMLRNLGTTEVYALDVDIP